LLEEPGPAVAVAGDFTTQPVAAAVIATINLQWLQGLRTARLIAIPQSDGLNISATLSYGEPSQAQAAADGVRFLDGWLRVLAPFVGGARARNLQIVVDRTDTLCQFELDDQTLTRLIDLSARFRPVRRPERSEGAD
jgi:hypothetical protein